MAKEQMIAFTETAEFNGMSDHAQYILMHFMNNKFHSTVFKKDAKQSKKLEAIKDAVKGGYLSVNSIPLCEDVQIVATQKLSNLYF